VALVVATFVPSGAARAQFVRIPKPASIIVTVSKSDQHMIVTVDGKPRFKWSVSTGARGYATPSGHCKVSWLDEHHKSKQYNDAPDALRDFLRCGQSHPWLRRQCRRPGVARVRAARDRQRQDTISFGRAAARPDRLEIRYDDYRSLILARSNKSQSASPSRCQHLPQLRITITTLERDDNST
jgi:hypothetical protein